MLKARRRVAVIQTAPCSIEGTAARFGSGKTGVARCMSEVALSRSTAARCVVLQSAARDERADAGCDESSDNRTTAHLPSPPPEGWQLGPGVAKVLRLVSASALTRALFHHHGCLLLFHSKLTCRPSLRRVFGMADLPNAHLASAG